MIEVGSQTPKQSRKEKEVMKVAKKNSGETTFNLSWEVEENGKKVEKTAKVVCDVKVKVPTIEDIRENVTSDVFMANVVYLLEQQLLQHQGSSATKSMALKFAKGQIDKPVLDGFVYEYDWQKLPSEKRSGDPVAKAAKAMAGLSEEQKAMLLAMLQKEASEDTED